jgi:2-polyprenyl-6-methoxyphenol hydroxylase-like FAD-dependent oxidoreductase
MAATNNTTPNGSNSNGVHSNGTIPPLPILIAGGGCVGLFLALLLSQSAIPNPIIVIEPLHPDPHSTRAMAHQPLIFSLFARADLMPEFSRLGSFSSGLCFRTSAKNGSKLIAGKQFKEGEKAQLLLAQGRFQEVLMRRLAEGGKGECRVGWELVGFEEREESVHVKIRDEDGREETIETEYLIGADGAHSRVRKLLDMPFNGETLPTQLVATDIIYDFHAHGFYDANFVIDPENYGLIGRINNDGMWRVSYGVPLETSDEDIHAGVGEKLRKMMPDGGSSGFEVKRVAPYKAQQRCVDKFWKGRVGLVGDAAHCTSHIYLTPSSASHTLTSKQTYQMQ